MMTIEITSTKNVGIIIKMNTNATVTVRSIIRAVRTSEMGKTKDFVVKAFQQDLQQGLSTIIIIQTIVLSDVETIQKKSSARIKFQGTIRIRMLLEQEMAMFPVM